MSQEDEHSSLEGAFGSIRTAVRKLDATAKTSRNIKRQTMSQIHALTHELHEVNRDLHELEGLVQHAEARR